MGCYHNENNGRVEVSSIPVENPDRPGQWPPRARPLSSLHAGFCFWSCSSALKWVGRANDLSTRPSASKRIRGLSLGALLWKEAAYLICASAWLVWGRKQHHFCAGLVVSDCHVEESCE